MDVISGHPVNVRSGRPQDGQIGSLGDVLETLKTENLGKSWGLIFADWVFFEHANRGILLNFLFQNLYKLFSRARNLRQ